MDGNPFGYRDFEGTRPLVFIPRAFVLTAAFAVAGYSALTSGSPGDFAFRLVTISALVAFAYWCVLVWGCVLVMGCASRLADAWPARALRARVARGALRDMP